MKKTAIIITISIFMLMTASCRGLSLPNILSPAQLDLDKSYEFTANIRHGEFNTAAQFQRKNTNNWEIILTEPFTVEGMTMIYEDGQFMAVYEDLTGIVTNDDAVYKFIIDSFENAIGGEGQEIISSGEQVVVSSNAYELVLEKDGLAPISLTRAGASLTVEFSEVVVSQVVPVIAVN
jgi:hypothetical protein